MRLQSAVEELIGQVDPASIETLARHIPFDWLEEALAASEGIAKLRKRRLPASQVVWLVLGMALFRNRPITDLVDKLDLALPDPRFTTVAPSAVCQARARVGEEPIQRLFQRCASEWAHTSAAADRWRGLALYGIDGTLLRTADTPEHRDFFGGPQTLNENSGYPLVRAVTLMALRSRLIADVRFGSYSKGEVVYAKDLWDAVPDHSLTIVDRGFLGAAALAGLQSSGIERHWLTRAKSNTSITVLKAFSQTDKLVELRIRAEVRQENPHLPESWCARSIVYQRPGFQPQTLLTSLLDPLAFPAEEIVRMYHERWELELGYDEIKTHLLERQETLRSRTIQGVKQEVWGIFLAYNLIRREMEQIASEAGVAPCRISFVAAMRLIIDEWMWSASSRSPGAIPKNLKRLRLEVKKFILPDRRRHRAYPRAVKLKSSQYQGKRSTISKLEAN